MAFSRLFNNLGTVVRWRWSCFIKKSIFQSKNRLRSQKQNCIFHKISIFRSIKIDFGCLKRPHIIPRAK